MSFNIVKGIISNYDYQEDYNDDGIKFKLHSFEINNQRYSAITTKNIKLDNELFALIYVDSKNKVDSGIIKSKNMKWGPNSKILKPHVTKLDQYVSFCGKLIKKELIENHRTEDVQHYRHFVLKLDNGKSFGLIEKFAKKIKKDDTIYVVLKNDICILIYNKTKSAYYGKIFPLFYIWILLNIGLSSWLTIYFLNGDLEEVSYYAALAFVNFMLLFLAFVNYKSYNYYLDAKSIIKSLTNEK